MAITRGKMGMVSFLHKLVLEILSLMAKEKKGVEPELSLRQKNKEEPAIRQRRQTRSRGSKGSELKQYSGSSIE